MSGGMIRGPPLKGVEEGKGRVREGTGVEEERRKWT